MKNLTVSTLIKFRGMKTEAGKRGFVSRLMQEDLEPEESDEQKKDGGNYWSSGLGAIHTAYKSDDVRVIKSRREVLESKHRYENRQQIKDMYKCNINILSEFENVDFRDSKPSGELKYLKKPSKDEAIISIRGVNIKASPDHVFSFVQDGIKQVGGVWLVASKGGFREGELGMYADILHRYLKAHFSKGHVINTEFCTVLDLVRQTEVHYSQIQQGLVPKILVETINDFNKYL